MAAERGDLRRYLSSCAVLLACLTLLQLAYGLLDPALLAAHGDRALPGWGGRAWRLLARSRSSVLFASLPVMWLFAVFAVQAGLPRRLSRRLLLVHDLALVLGSVAVLTGLFSLRGA